MNYNSGLLMPFIFIGMITVLIEEIASWMFGCFRSQF